jgi:hypothetical protein
MWDYSKTPPRPLPRWRLYEDRARAALEAIHVDEVSQALQAILRQVKSGRSTISRSLLDGRLVAWNEVQFSRAASWR